MFGPIFTKKLLRAFWLLGIVAVIVGSLLPSDYAPIQSLDRLPFSDKFDHVAMYAVLAFLPALHEEGKVVVFLVIGAVGLGIALEYVQLYLARDFEVGDMIADAAGAVLGLAAGLSLRVRVRK